MSYFTLRMQFGPHQDASEISRQVQHLLEHAPVDEVMFFFFGEEQNDGHETPGRIREWIKNSRPYRDLLRQSGIPVSLNPWHTILHSDSGRTLKSGQTWQTLVDPAGRQASAMVCFLDPGWRKYYLETLKLYAAEKFRVIWIDDDIRYHNHQPLEWGGCFCPLHIAEFNKRAGTQASREEIVKACLAPGQPHPWRSIWMDTWQETVLEFLGQCHAVLAGNGVRMGLMSSSMEAHSAEGRRWRQWWDTFGGGKPPIHRPHFWGYSDAPGSHLIYGMASIDQNRSIQPAVVESGPEIECFPYGTWNKSFRQTFAQMVLAQMHGATNLNISLFDFMGNNIHDVPEKTEFLKRVRPAMDWLSDTFPDKLRTHGVGLPWSEDLGRLIQLDDGATWSDLQVSSRGWGHWLGAAGISFSTREAETVNAISGAVAWGLSDEIILRMLKKSLLLDGMAANILVNRGFGQSIGISSCRMVTQNDMLYSIEECVSEEFSFRTGVQMTVNNKQHTKRMLQAELDSSASIISVLRSPTQKILGHGAFTFINPDGGKVAVVPWDASVSETPLIDVYRTAQLVKIISWLSVPLSIGTVEGGAWLVPQFFRSGDTWRAVIWNVSSDDHDAIHVHRPSGMPPIRSIFHLQPSGEILTVAPVGDTMTLASPLRQWECLILVC